MLEGLYSAASGLAAQQTRLDAVANDLANVSTTGYKRVRLAFRDLAYGRTSSGTGAGVQLGAGTAATQAGRDFAQGAFAETGRTLDVALDGPGFLRVRRADGTEALTRNGALQLDDRGRLSTADGDLVQPAIAVPAGVDPAAVRVAADGTITAGGAALGRLQAVDVPNPDGLLALGGSLFSATAASGAVVPAATTRLVGGALEQSSVDVASAMTEMIEAQRAFQLASRAISTRDEVWGIANGVKR